MQTNVTYWLDRTASLYPTKIGFSDKNRRLSFDEMKTEALNIAAFLVRSNMFKKPVAVFMDKSVEELIVFLGVAYSGNFYSPIDVQMPRNRRDKILDVFQPEVIITKREYAGQIEDCAANIKIVCIEDIYFIEQNAEIVYRQRDRCCDTDLLYVLFTSGSTGTPKGVTICHQSVIDYIEWVEKEFQIDSTVVFGNQAPFYFDNSILDIYTTIKTGAEMNIIPQELFSWPIKLLQYLKIQKINTIFWVPSAMILVSKLKALSKVELKDQIKNILFCGEVMPNKHLNEWRKYLPDAVYANLYGPTEITDVCVFYRVDREFTDEEPLPIGRALPNTDILVLTEDNREASQDEVGELCVRGTSLSKGYYNNPEKTRQGFVQNPLNDKYIELIYRTGDLVKKNSYGEIEYLGRKDFQIKHMGHRIELGEIETAISSVEQVTQACCVYDKEKEKIVVFTENQMELSELNRELEKLIPEYMLPNRLIYVEQMPLNMNGKIDRRGLQEML